jgi:hypothetical protein
MTIRLLQDPIRVQHGTIRVMAQFPPVPVKQFMIDEFCRFCYTTLAFTWFRSELYEFHITILRGKHVYCPMCGKCQCGMKEGWTQPPHQFIEI